MKEYEEPKKENPLFLLIVIVIAILALVYLKNKDAIVISEPELTSPPDIPNKVDCEEVLNAK